MNMDASGQGVIDFGESAPSTKIKAKSTEAKLPNISVRDRRVIEYVLAQSTQGGTSVRGIHRAVGLFSSENLTQIAVSKLVTAGLLKRSGQSLYVGSADLVAQALERDSDFDDLEGGDANEHMRGLNSIFEIEDDIEDTIV